jgi:hypothetical protein
MGRRYGADHQTTGAKLAPKIALLVGQVLDEHLHRSGHKRSEIGAQAAIKFFKTITDERNTHTADFLETLIGREGTDPKVEKLLRFMHHGHGELSAMLSTHAVASSVATGLGSGLANLLAPLNQAIMYDDPAQVLEPSTMASLAAQQIVSQEYAAHIARMSGLPEEAEAYLVEAARAYPGVAELLELLRRGQIDGREAVLAMQRSGIPEQFIGPFLTLEQVFHSPEDLALMVLKGIKSEADVLGEAKANGVDAARLHDLVLMSGEPPGLEQLAEYYRRGFIDKARFQHGVRESRVKDEWFDVIVEARFARASPSDALRGVVQNHLSNEEGKQIAEEAGLDPRDWKWLVESEGNPASPTEMLELWRRGKTSKSKVEQAIREGRIKNKYIGELTDLKRAVPGLFQITKLLSSGGISEQEGSRLLHELGYESDVVAGIIHSSAHEAVVKDKAVAKTEVLELLYDHAIDEARAEQLLKALGYSKSNAHLLILLVNLQREKALRQAAMSPIRSAYISRHIPEQEASKQLDQIGTPHAERDFALARWTVDREAHVKQLTEAQIVKANERGLMSDVAAEQRLQAQGYSHGDARILLDLEKDRTAGAP